MVSSHSIEMNDGNQDYSLSDAVGHSYGQALAFGIYMYVLGFSLNNFHVVFVFFIAIFTSAIMISIEKKRLKKENNSTEHWMPAYIALLIVWCVIVLLLFDQNIENEQFPTWLAIICGLGSIYVYVYYVEKTGGAKRE